MFEYIDLLGLDAGLKDTVLNIPDSNYNKISALAEKYANGNNKCLVNRNDLTRLAVVTEALKFTKEKYNNLGIAGNIFDDTVKDIGIWCGNNENKGLKNYNWIKNHVRAELFKIGRLQFQIYKCDNVTLHYKKLPFKLGENLVYIHIPQGEKLIYEDCINSIKSAIVFFDKFFPDYKFKYFFCESWLLYQGNCQFMKADSNIMKFSSLFEIAYSLDLDAQAIDRIFGKKRIIKSRYSENTSLQKATKKHILNGGKLGFGIGYIDKELFYDKFW
ncbi:MAG: acyltransferase domain-containing protein [Eubacterium sp.]